MNNKLKYILRKLKVSNYQWIKINRHCKVINKQTYLYLFKLRKKYKQLK